MIEAREVVVRLGGRVVVDAASLRLTPGEVVALIGPPEAGKTVLVKALAGLLPIAAGSITFAGEAPTPMTRQRIGMAFQNDALFDALTVYDNVAFPLVRRGVPPDQVERRAMERLTEVGLAAARDKLPSEISGGMRRRVGIARATVIEPEVGLFDDPTAGLDPVTGSRILALIVGLTERLRMSTVIVSNDLGVLLPIAHRVQMLVGGRMVFSGTTDELWAAREPVVRQFVTGADDGPL